MVMNGLMAIILSFSAFGLSLKLSARENNLETQELVLEIKARLQSWKGELAVETTDKSIQSNIAAALRKIKCMENKIDRIDWITDSKVWLCKKSEKQYDPDTTSAYTLPVGNNIHLCQGFYNLPRYKKRSLMVHELSHKCLTTDIAYFDILKITPRSYKGVPWPYIASTYEYWMENGVCIPQINC